MLADKSGSSFEDFFGLKGRFCQPRPAPWEEVGSAMRFSPERAQQPAKGSRLSRPFRAWAVLPYQTPGRCPGLICFGPFGAKFARFVRHNKKRMKMIVGLHQPRPVLG